MLHKLIFDTTDAASIAASANVGAYLRASDGTLLTHTGGALNVSFSTITDLDIRDLDASQDNVAISDGTDTLAVNADGSINVVTTATDLDIRDLDSASDSVAAVQSGTWEVALDAATLAALETVTVTATDLDIRDLAAATDSVSAWLSDGAGNTIGSTAGALDVNIKSGDLDDSLANTDLVAGSTSIPTTAGGTDLRATDLAGRKWLIVYNNGNKDVFIGKSGVTAGTGFPLPPGAALELRAGPAINAYAIASAGTQDVRTLELS
jgi:hypothetical protein